MFSTVFYPMRNILSLLCILFRKNNLCRYRRQKNRQADNYNVSAVSAEAEADKSSSASDEASD